VIGVAERPTALTLTIGAGVSFERDVVIAVRAAADNELTIGDVTILHDRTTLQLHGGSIVFGDHVQVRRDALLKSSGRLTIGARTQVSHGAIVHCAARVDIEPCVALAERVTVVDSDHVFDGTDEHWMTRPLKLMPVHIGRNAFVGTNAVVMRGARIGANAVIAPSSVVPRGDYEASWLHAGSPARPVKELRPAPAPS
jgi:carbonic anhydrase/acetyltransferase-like protein (isoleucine patch superfamily)